MVSLVGAQACPQAPKAVAQMCSVKKVFLKISQNSQGNTCARASFLIKLQAPATVNFAKFLRTPFFTDTPGSFSWNTATEGWMVQGIEDYLLWNISNRINLRRPNFDPKYQVSCFLFRWVMHHVSMYFLGKAVFRFLPKVKRSCFRGEKKLSFQIIQEKSCAGPAPFGKTIFSEGLKKIYFRVFFKKDHLSFSVQRARSYFGEKEISSFPIIQERSYSTAIFLERPSFQDVRKKKIWFFVQCIF